MSESLPAWGLLPRAGLVLLLIAGPVHVSAQTAVQGQGRLEIMPRPTVTIQQTAQPPSIDGRLDDSAWQGATRITDFYQRRPIEGAPSTEKTEVFITYDSQRIYVGVHAHYSDTSIMRVNRLDRDQTQSDDKVTIYFDPFMDQQRAFALSVNGYGVQRDFLMSGGTSGGGGDNAWNALYDTAGRLVEDGWTAEMSIPFKSLRYPARPQGETHRWALQVERDIEGKNEAVTWAAMSSNVIGFVRQFGVLEGLQDLSPSRNLELLPTATAITVGNRNDVTGDWVKDDLVEGGLNVKYGITSDLTLDATYNPDFSQIESDRSEIVVNQRFPIMYPELRPFFLEGREIYQVPAPVTVVHTRTIIDPLFGAKLAGKIGRTSIGLLIANDEAPGQVADPRNAAFEQKAQVSLARFRYDMRAGSHLGVLYTDREFLSGYSRLAGVDGRWQIGRSYRLDAKAMTTRNQDEEGARDSGELTEVVFRKEGRHLNYDVTGHTISPEFRTDVGFVRRTDVRRAIGNAFYRWWPETWIINWNPKFTYERNSDYNDVLQDVVYAPGVDFLFQRYITASAQVNRDMERFGGIDFWKTRYTLRANVNSSRRVAFGVTLSGGDQVLYIDDPFLGSQTDSTLTVTLRPVSRLQSDLRLTTSQFTDPADAERFDVKIFRAVTTYQFTDRLVIRNITQYDSQFKRLDFNLLGTYRVNAGTVFYLGYDDHLEQENAAGDPIFTTSTWQRTNRAIFTKLQYLFRY